MSFPVRILSRALSCALVITMAGAVASSATVPRPRPPEPPIMVKLEVPAGTLASDAVAVNAAGTVVGFIQTEDGSWVPVKWDRSGKFTRLGLPPGATGDATDINDRGVIIGNGSDGTRVLALRWNSDNTMTVLDQPSEPGGAPVGMIDNAGEISSRNLPGMTPWTPVRWDSRGRITELATLASGTTNDAEAINQDGSITGFAGTAAGTSRAVVWDRHGRITVLPTLGGESFGWGMWINDHGVVVGSASTGAGETHPARWDRNGRVTPLELPADSTFGRALAVNNHDVAIGAIGDGSAAMWDRAGRLTLLEPGNSFASRISDSGVVVGQADNHAAAWDRHGTWTDLGTLPGDTDSQAMDVNNDGVIVGYSYGTSVTAVLWRLRD